jgi:hypothetical protein
MLRMTETEARKIDAQIERPPQVWKRSARGNLWSKRGPYVLTVFARRDGTGYSWCVSGLAHGRRPRFSQHSYDSEDEAIAALRAEINRTLAG